jgi:hypothetical protein
MQGSGYISPEKQPAELADTGEGHESRILLKILTE